MGPPRAGAWVDVHVNMQHVGGCVVFSGRLGGGGVGTPGTLRSPLPGVVTVPYGVGVPVWVSLPGGAVACGGVALGGWVSLGGISGGRPRGEMRPPFVLRVRGGLPGG